MYAPIKDFAGEWVHYICGLLCDDYEIPDMAAMEFTYEVIGGSAGSS